MSTAGADRHMRDEFPQQIKELLAKRVGNCCSNPDCRQPTFGPQINPKKALNVGVAAHITAASPLGPRYSASLTTEERTSVENGIWLCQKCSKLVDNDEERYTSEVLRSWRGEAEGLALKELEGRGPQAARRPSRLTWDADVFWPLEANSGERLAIGRFLELQDRNQIVLETELVERFNETLGSQRVAIISGASGSGKTIASLALADRFAAGTWRVFYVSLRHDISEQQLVDGVRHRAICPTVFVFDDAHQRLDLVELALERLTAVLRSSKIRIVVTLQLTGLSDEDYDGPTREFMDECRANEAVLELTPTEAQYAAIAARARPALARLSKEHIQRLLALSGQSLRLLGEVLSLIEEPSELDSLDLERLYPRVLLRYFGKTGGVHAPDLKRLAALAQLDVAVPVSDLSNPFEPGWEEAVARLTLTSGRPESRAFFHASTAELVFRALSWADRDDDPIAKAASICIDHLRQAEPKCLQELLVLFTSRLRLGPDYGLKHEVLSNASVIENIASVRDDLPLYWLSRMTMLTRAAEPLPPFANWMADRVVRMVEAPSGVEQHELGTLGWALRELGLLDPGQKQLRALEAKIDPAALVQLIGEHADLPAFLGILRYCSLDFSGRLIQALDPSAVESILKRTHDSQTSLGTINLALRELGLRDPKQEQLSALEAKIDPAALVHLIGERADFPSLLRILAKCTSDFSGRLIQALDRSAVESILKRTHDSQTSLGTINLALRDLGLRDEDQAQLRALEAKIDPAALLLLIRERGVLPSFLKILQYCSPPFGRTLVVTTDRATVTQLIDQAIAEGSSVGALGLFFQTLRRRLRDRYELLESLIDPNDLWRLFATLGDLRGLSHLLPVLGESLREAFVSAEHGCQEHWDSITARSDFYAICHFTRDCAPGLTKEARVRLIRSVDSCLSESVESTSWSSLAGGLAIVAELPTSGLKRRLSEAARERGARLTLADLAIQEDLDSAQGLLNSIRRLRPDLWPTAAVKLWEIVPPKSAWPTGDELFSAGRHLLVLAALPEVSQSDAERVIRAYNGLSPKALDGVDAGYQWLFFWNLFLVWHERGRPLSRTFRDLQHRELWDNLVRSIHDRAAKGDAQYRLNVVALAGAICFLIPEMCAPLGSALRNRLAVARDLLQEARSLEKLHAFFALQGLSLVLSPRAAFPPDRCQELLAQLDDCDDQFAALDVVRSLLRKFGRQKRRT